MSDAERDEKERLEQWRALQIALGLLPDESPAAAAQQQPPPSPRPQVKFEARAEPVESAAIAADEFTPHIEHADAAARASDPAEAEQDVEVGEAPEEVPDEAPAPGDKRRRRRRRRRRHPGEEGEGQAAEGETETEAEPAINGAPAPLSGERDQAEELEDDEAGDDDDDDVEPINIPDWNVPTWQELIASLYRPER